MCGRFTQKSERPDIQLEFYIQEWQVEPAVSYNIAPSQKAGVVINDGQKNIYAAYQWGLIPHWAKDPKIGYNMINAKAETIDQKPSFKGPFKSKRCLIPAEGFYEWKKTESKKIPYYIFLIDDPVFSMAGLYDEWSSSENEKLCTFTIITTEANELIAEIHDKKRMPVIIQKKDRERWLNNGRYNKTDMLNLLKPYESDFMDAYEVSALVNSPKNNNAQCIERVV
ncbi:MAG: SOS response-associated peptidase [Spirochaetes bacterium]|nr:SOS response-associated peptidase [Spirochaetota bacterium]